MKRLILLLILFVNLQIVITHEDMRIFSYLTASVQHMTKEGNDNCYLEGFGWYYCPVPDCEVDVIAYIVDIVGRHLTPINRQETGMKKNVVE